jgi:LacI family transcriptional regulator
MKEVTIYDIARETGVSAATVSRSLKNNAAISDKVKKLVQEKAEEMGYRTNTFASRLRTKKTNTIGVIVPRLDSHFISTVLAGIEKIANDNDYNLIISQSFESAKKEATNASTLFNSRVDGLIVSLASDTSSMKHFKKFIDKKIPLLFFDRGCQEFDCINVVIDNEKMGYEATKHLLEKGCRRIYHVSGNPNRDVYAKRLKGYTRALNEFGIPFDPEWVFETKMTIDDGINTAKNFLSRESLPDGVFIANDACAAGCISELKENGIKIPEDIAIVGFNNDPISRVVEPKLTTIHYPGYEMGEMVSKIMIEQLKNEEKESFTNCVYLEAKLIERQSTNK